MWINENLITENSIGFIYIIEHIKTGEFYIGKKNLTSYKTVNKKKVYSESKWRDYYGSNKEFLSYVKEQGKDMFKRTIIVCCDTQYKLTYNELKYQIIYDWEDSRCWNSNLLGTFYKKKLI